MKAEGPVRNPRASVPCSSITLPTVRNFSLCSYPPPSHATSSHPSTKNTLRPTFMSATTLAPPPSSGGVLSDPLQDKPTSYVPPRPAEWVGYSLQSTLHPYKRVKTSWTLGSFKQKTENPNKLTLNKFNRHLKFTASSLTSTFLYLLVPSPKSSWKLWHPTTSK